jgi:hypothetical protein
MGKAKKKTDIGGYPLILPSRIETSGASCKLLGRFEDLRTEK